MISESDAGNERDLQHEWYIPDVPFGIRIVKKKNLGCISNKQLIFGKDPVVWMGLHDRDVVARQIWDIHNIITGHIKPINLWLRELVCQHKLTVLRLCESQHVILYCKSYRCAGESVLASRIKEKLRKPRLLRSYLLVCETFQDFQLLFLN